MPKLRDNPYYELARILITYGHEEYLTAYEKYIKETYDPQRGEMNFINGFLDYTKDAESPELFFRWGAIVALAAVMRDNVWWPTGLNGRLYPNLYVILTAKSGACRKSVPLKQVEKLIREINNTKIIAGRTSIQAAMRILSETRTVKGSNGSVNILKGASGVLYSEELAAFMVEDKAVIPILTDIYDHHSEYESHLIAQGSMKLEKTCVTMFAVSNEKFLKDVYTDAAVYGGLLGRTILVVAKETDRVNSRMWVNEEEDARKFKLLVEHLRHVSSIKGPMKVEEEARVCYDSWYKEFRLNTKGNETDDGVLSRIHTTVQKVSMCLAMAEHKTDGTVKVKHVEEAVEHCMMLVKNYDFMIMGAGATKQAKPGTMIFAALAQAPGYSMSFTSILQKFLGQFDSAEFDRNKQTLIEAGLAEVVTKGSKPSLRLTQEAIEKIQEKALELGQKTKDKK